MDCLLKENVFWLGEHPMAELARRQLAQRHVIDGVHMLQSADFAVSQMLHELAKSRVENGILVDTERRTRPLCRL